MFTGIVQSIGKVAHAERASIRVASSFEDLEVGQSIAVSGCCITVTSALEDAFTADLSEETISRTTLGSLSTGSRVNLERPLRPADPLGGHFLQGHVDGVGEIQKVEQLAGSVLVTIVCPPELSRYLGEKGSVGVDGVSLTVVKAGDAWFSVSLIPLTLESTTLGSEQPGDEVNIEVDILAKYVERLLDRRGN